MIYNFNISPRSGKTYYEENQNWKYLKSRIKQILDEKQSNKYTKIIEIQALLEHYEEVYLKGGKNK